MDVRNTGGNKYETTAREIQNYQFSTFFGRSKMTSRKVTATALKVNVKKFQPTSTSSLACVLTNLDAFCPMGVHLPGEKSILPYFSSPRGVAILDCDSHSQAGSTTPSPPSGDDVIYEQNRIRSTEQVRALLAHISFLLACSNLVEPA